MNDSRPEVWLRGAVPGVPALVQPVAHALLQAVEEAEVQLGDYPAALLWTRPGGVASVGFHLQHMRGVVDRLFTYARGEALSEAQRAALSAEAERGSEGAEALVRAFSEQVERAITQLRATDASTLTDARAVGRKQLPSTVLGLLFHAAEHVQRHMGQLLVTARIQQAEASRVEE